MAKKRKKLNLSRLYTEPPDDMRLASLQDGRVEGLAFRYTIIIPLFSEQTGQEIFSLDSHVIDLMQLLGQRFGGFTLLPVSRGAWIPEGTRVIEGDRIIHVYVYTRQQDGVVDRFFQYLKYRLKSFSGEEEIVIEKTEVQLLGARASLR